MHERFRGARKNFIKDGPTIRDTVIEVILPRVLATSSSQECAAIANETGENLAKTPGSVVDARLFPVRRRFFRRGYIHTYVRMYVGM